MSYFFPIISRAATFRRSSDGHNSAIFHPILTFKYTKKISSSRRIDWWKDLSSISFRSDFHILSHYLPPVATWTTMAICSQNHTQIVSNWYVTYHAQPITQNRCEKKIVYHTPPLTKTNFVVRSPPGDALDSLAIRLLRTPVNRTFTQAPSSCSLQFNSNSIITSHSDRSPDRSPLRQITTSHLPHY